MDWDADSLLSAFVRAVSHDLRSPLLTLSLSAELLREAPSTEERDQVAREGMQHGIEELDRMLDAITGISRARSRVFVPQQITLGELLRGHVVLSETELVAHTAVSLDSRCVTETLLVIAGESATNVRLDLGDGAAHLVLTLPEAVSALEDTPVHALLSSLQQYAGTPVAALAAAQVQLERQGGAMRCAGGRLFLDLPLVDSAYGASRP